MADVTPITTKTTRTRKLKGAESIAQTAKNTAEASTSATEDEKVARTAFVDEEPGSGDPDATTATASTAKDKGQVLHPPVFPEGIDGNPVDVLESAEIRRVAEELIDTHDQLQHLRGKAIAYFWQRKGGKSGGQPVFSRAGLANGREKVAFKAVFIITVSADHYSVAGPDENATKGIIFHALRHCGIKVDDRTEEESPCIVPHDVEMFYDEFIIFGPYRAAMEQVQTITRQTSMFDGETMQYRGRM